MARTGRHTKNLVIMRIRKIASEARSIQPDGRKKNVVNTKHIYHNNEILTEWHTAIKSQSLYPMSMDEIRAKKKPHKIKTDYCRMRVINLKWTLNE